MSAPVSAPVTPSARPPAAADGPPAAFEPPVLVYGALRSGTTVFRLMLNAHPGISNPGEVDFLFDCLAPDPSHPTGWRYDLDRLRAHRVFGVRELDISSGNDGLDLLEEMLAQLRARGAGVATLNLHRHADRIAAVFPHARVIHLLRDPRDVARSCVGMGWAGISYYGLDPWLRTETAWEAARRAGGLPEDRVLELRFEALMGDLEGELRRVCAFLGVPFEPAMLDYHRDTTYDPPDPRLTEQWRRRATPREVALLEGRCGPLLAARGYEAAGAPRHPGALEARLLGMRNVTGRWRASMRRYGLPLLVTARLAKLAGARGAHRRLRQRMAERVTQSVK
jgi:hypothetical protein